MKKLRNILEVFARAMVQPLLFLPAAGMMLALGSLLTNTTVTQLLPFLAWGPFPVLGRLMYETMMILIGNLGVLFALGIPAALARKEKHQAGFIGFLSYLIYLKTSNLLLAEAGILAEGGGMTGLYGTGQAVILGIQAMDMGAFGGILLGCITGWVFNRTCEKNFGGALRIYSGVRFSFLCMTAAAALFGAVSNWVWPLVQEGISALAECIKGTGSFGLFLYGFLERLLIPTGLHHLIYVPFQFTELGGVLNLGGTAVTGAYPIVMAEMQMGLPFSDSIYYMAIGFTKMFGYIGIGAAFVYTALPQNRRRTAATVVPLVLTACLSCVTEPMDFLFLFSAPVLYLLHACLAGAFIVLLKVFDVTAFCGGNLLASLLLNLSAGVERTRWPVMVLLGLVQILVYFFLFSFFIKRFRCKTPGREEAAPDPEAGRAGISGAEAAILLEGLGGRENIEVLDSCFTRLRIRVKDPDLVKESVIATVPHGGLIRRGKDLQIVFGLQAARIREIVEDCLKTL